ncbi:uncharacterized protein LOC133867941 [Alnus glutinosa]|uniref:uncharacterized protein LOC133867941 n=1 Tax=Alnus glutinosa TaxID=3517 RepID=UPI002D79E899|nr:uncharacterized protein LOC133867941 [Alnus glutinosa]
MLKVGCTGFRGKCQFLGLTGSVVLRSGQLSDIIAQLQELLKGANEVEVPPYKYDTLVLAAHIQQLAQEIREFAVSSLVTIFNGDSTPNGSYASFLVPVAARGTMRYCYMGWKGWWLPDVESIGFDVESIQQMLYGLEVEIVVGWLIFRHFNHGKLNLAGAETVVWKATHRLLCSLRYRWWKFRRKLLHAQALPLNQVTEVFLVPQFNGADPDQPRFSKKWKQQQEIEITRQLFDELTQPSRLGLIVPKYVVVQKFQDKDELYQDEERVTVTQKNEELKLQEGMTITSLKNFQDSVWPYQDEEAVFDGLLERELELRSDMVRESSHQRLDLVDLDARIQLAYQMKGLFLCFNGLVFPCKGASFIQLHTLWARCSKEGGIVIGGFLQDK